MSVVAWDYYVSYVEPENDPEKDGFIFRHRPDEFESEGQLYVGRGEWIRSTILLDLAFGHDHREVMPVSVERARELMDRWVRAGRFPQAPDDWE